MRAERNDDLVLEQIWNFQYMPDQRTHTLARAQKIKAKPFSSKCSVGADNAIACVHTSYKWRRRSARAAMNGNIRQQLDMKATAVMAHSRKKPTHTQSQRALAHQNDTWIKELLQTQNIYMLFVVDLLQKQTH